jgi:hypothetical protein
LASRSSSGLLEDRLRLKLLGPIPTERGGAGSLYGLLARARPTPRAELLIDCEEDRVLRAVLVGMLREADRSGPSQGPDSVGISRASTVA